MSRLWTPTIIGLRRDGSPIYEIAGGAEGGYRNLRAVSSILVDESAVTLVTTMKSLWPVARTTLPANFWWPGKRVKLTVWGKVTTDGTAGNYVFEMAYGSGDAPTALVAGATVAGTVSQTAKVWKAEGYAECRTVGATGTLRMMGQWSPVVSVLASTLQPYEFPENTPADVTIDTTASGNALTYQLQRSGAGVWTATTTNIFLEELN
jgi:hypothetical protein